MKVLLRSTCGENARKEIDENPGIIFSPSLVFIVTPSCIVNKLLPDFRSIYQFYIYYQTWASLIFV
jgi:hypothetical protein